MLRMFLLVVGMEKGCRANTSVIESGHYWWSDAGRQAIVAILRTFGHYIGSSEILCDDLIVESIKS